MGGGEMFDLVAPHYDIANTVMALGYDQAWRHELVAAVDVLPSDVVLDVGTGTAEVAVKLAAKARSVQGIDPSPRMLEKGREKIREGNLTNLELSVADARKLPFEDEAFDKVTVAFALRNVPVGDRDRAIAEVARVVSAKGRVGILEASLPRESTFLGWLARTFVGIIVPVLGSLVQNRPEEYQYMVESINDFPVPEEFRTQIERNGLSVLDVKHLCGGVMQIYIAVRKM
jgi:demethylmenaquinone methyltransferase/2-methoxy-6-polyprenyl-1,4-benzoquinol methylase